MALLMERRVKFQSVHCSRTSLSIPGVEVGSVRSFRTWFAVFNVQGIISVPGVGVGTRNAQERTVKTRGRVSR